MHTDAWKSDMPSNCRYSVRNARALLGIVPTMPCTHEGGEALYIGQSRAQTQQKVTLHVGASRLLCFVSNAVCGRA